MIITNFINKIKGLSQSKQSNLTQEFLSKYLFENRIPPGTGIDTIRLCLELARPDKFILTNHLDFCLQKTPPKHHSPYIKQKNKNKEKITYYANIKTSSVTIKLHWTSVSGRDWLSVECSLPRLVSGNVLHVFKSNEEILTAIDKLSQIVSDKIKISADFRLGHCSRIDLFCDLQFDDDKTVNDLIKLSCFMTLSRHIKLDMYMGTARWQNPGKKAVTFELDFYNKTKKEKKQDKNFPKGILRIESRFLETQTIKRVATSDYYNKETKTFNLEKLLDVVELERLFDYHCPIERKTLSGVIQ